MRYKPLPDELLSSWLVRLAHGHGLKVQTFCNLLFGSQLQVWNRDIDRLAPAWLLTTLSKHTGVPIQDAQSSTLRVFEGHLYKTFKEAGYLQGIQSMLMYHRKREGYGQQYCPECLGLDSIPYFRKTWRVSFKTVCVQHECMLMDRCAQCTAPVSYHRIDMGLNGLDIEPSMRNCHVCQFNLADAPRLSPEFHDCPESLSWAIDLVRQADNISSGLPSSIDLSELDVLHYLMRLMVTHRKSNRLNAYVADRIGAQAIEWPSPKRIVIESLPCWQRHQLLLQGSWLMLDLAERIKDAWKAKAILYNHLVNDFTQMPDWFRVHVIAPLDRRPYNHRRS